MSGNRSLILPFVFQPSATSFLSNRQTHILFLDFFSFVSSGGQERCPERLGKTRKEMKGLSEGLKQSSRSHSYVNRWTCQTFSMSRRFFSFSLAPAGLTRRLTELFLFPSSPSPDHFPFPFFIAAPVLFLCLMRCQEWKRKRSGM